MRSGEEKYPDEMSSNKIFAFPTLAKQLNRMKVKIILNEEHVANDNQRMTSLEIADITGKPHNDVLKAIRKMEQAWVKVTQGNFSLSTYSTFETAFLRY